MAYIYKNPPVLNGCLNPIVADIRSNDFIETSGSKPLYYIMFHSQQGAVAPGEYFTLQMGLTTLVFTCAAIPDGSGLQFPELTGSMSVKLPLLYNCLAANYYITEHYTVTLDLANSRIILQGKEYADDFNLTWGTSTAAALYMMGNGGTDRVERPFFNLWLKVLNESGTELGEDLLPVDADGHALFNIAEYLRAEIPALFTFPVDGTVITDRNTMRLKFMFKYGEFYGDELPFKKMLSSGYFYAIRGGIPWHRSTWLYANYPSLLGYLKTSKAFMTWAPVTKVTNTTLAEKLYFYFTASLAAVSLEFIAKLTYQDGHTLTLTIKVQAASQHDLWEISCNYSDLSLATYDNDPDHGQISSYQVWIQREDTSALISEKRTFRIDRRDYYNERSFIFRNSFGCFDILRTTGAGQKDNAFEREFYDNTSLRQFNRKFHERKQYLVEHQESFAVSTGWLTPDELEWMHEILLSEEVYEIVGSYLQPVIITSQKVFFKKDNEYLYSQEFEYSRVHQKGVYYRTMAEDADDSGLPRPAGIGHMAIESTNADIPTFQIH
jgi:hypothetical protein